MSIAVAQRDKEEHWGLLDDCISEFSNLLKGIWLSAVEQNDQCPPFHVHEHTEVQMSQAQIYKPRFIVT